MTKKHWTRRLAGGTLALVAVTFIGGSQIAAASGLGEAGLEALNITEATYDAARDEAKIAYNAELVALGWISAEEAAAENTAGDWAHIGRGQYYEGILDKDTFVADALGVTAAQLDAAEDASHEAESAERIAAGRMTAEEAANRQAVYAFKEGIDVVRCIIKWHKPASLARLKRVRSWPGWTVKSRTGTEMGSTMGAGASSISRTG
jgi:hypothetical protein